MCSGNAFMLLKLFPFHEFIVPASFGSEWKIARMLVDTLGYMYIYTYIYICIYNFVIKKVNDLVKKLKYLIIE